MVGDKEKIVYSQLIRAKLLEKWLFKNLFVILPSAKCSCHNKNNFYIKLIKILIKIIIELTVAVFLLYF